MIIALAAVGNRAPSHDSRSLAELLHKLPLKFDAFSWREGGANLSRSFPQMNSNRSHIASDGTFLDENRVQQAAKILARKAETLSRNSLDDVDVSWLGYQPSYSTGVYSLVGSLIANGTKAVVENAGTGTLPLGIRRIRRIKIANLIFLFAEGVHSAKNTEVENFLRRFIHYSKWTRQIGIPAFEFRSMLVKTPIPDYALSSNAHGYLDKYLMERAHISVGNRFRFGMVIQANYYARCCFDRLPEHDLPANTYVLVYQASDSTEYFHGFGRE